MGYTNDSIKDNLEEWVEHLEKMSHLFAQSYHYLSQTEFGGAMHNIKLSIRRIGNCILQIANEQRKTLLVVAPMKMNKILQSLGHIKSDITLPQSFDVDNDNWDEEDTTDWDALITIENNETPFNIGDDYEEYHHTRRFLMSNIRHNYMESVAFIKTIIQLLGEIEDNAKKIETDVETQKKLYNQMQDDYRNSDWSIDRASFIAQVNEAIAEGANNGKDQMTVMTSELNKLKSEHLNSYMPAPIKRLYNTVVNLRRPPYEAIVKYRMRLSEDDISDYFSFLFRYTTLKEHIDSVTLLKEVTRKYEKLFTCLAAKEYVDLLSPVLTMFGGLECKEHYGVLLTVMRELGLTPCDGKPYLPMMNYANEKLNGAFDDQSMIRKSASKFEKIRLCKLEYGDRGDTTLTEVKIKEYQEVYWRCFTILNQRGLRFPKEMTMASYLHNPHPNVNLSIAMDGYPVERLIRLNFLRSVLRGETLVFG